jgi:bifunctional DNA-binding transcriptional regulator/antitoxin component of YhaV-PrlF toxin-antitoxin module
MLTTRILTTIRRDDGDDFYVVIPPVAMKRFGLEAGDEIEFEPEKIPSALDRNPELKAAVDRLLKEDRDALDYLAHDDVAGDKRRPRT